jgi:NADPH:quinone reductase-like Zn-dependent oxidoreductase
VAEQIETGLQLRSLVKKEGQLQVSLETVPTPEPAADEVIVRIEASPINPSDLGLLLGGADMSTAMLSGTRDKPVLSATVSPAGLKAMAGRIDQSMPVGNEGAGTVVKAGTSDGASALLGKTVAIFGGAMYAQYRCIKAADCLVLPEDATAVDGASAFVNPLTALGMTETMRRDGHTALVHTAAASNLGQMLNRICLNDGIGLVNIVRSAQQVELLRKAGAKHVCDSSSETFMDDLTNALKATGATIAFDAVGGGNLADQILTCMEQVAISNAANYSRYGSTVHKQVYSYGRLNTSPTILNRSNYGSAWGISGWLLMPFLHKIGPADAQRLRDRVAAEIKTTFASHYTQEISLREVLQLDVVAAYNKRATGEKFLIVPQKP